MSPRGPRERLTDIVEAIDTIRSHERFLDEKEVDRDHAVRLDAVVRQLAIISEAVASLDDELLAAEPSIRWSDIKGVRIIFDHKYHATDPDVVWETVDRDLEELRRAADRLTGRLDDER